MRPGRCTEEGTRQMEQRAAKTAPVAMMLLVAGLMLGLAGRVGPRLVHKAAGSDFERGLMVGVGIGLEILALVLMARCARGKR